MADLKHSEVFDKVVASFEATIANLPFKPRAREDLMAGFKQGVSNTLAHLSAYSNTNIVK